MVPAGPGHHTCHPRWFLGLRLSPLMVLLQQAIPYLLPLVTFYDMQENTAVQSYSPRNCLGLDSAKYLRNCLGLDSTKYLRNCLGLDSMKYLRNCLRLDSAKYLRVTINQKVS